MIYQQNFQLLVKTILLKTEKVINTFGATPY